MTPHEKTRLIELLTSGDEANILMAKAICEGQRCVDPIKFSFESMIEDFEKKSSLFYMMGLDAIGSLVHQEVKQSKQQLVQFLKLVFDFKENPQSKIKYYALGEHQKVKDYYNSFALSK